MTHIVGGQVAAREPGLEHHREGRPAVYPEPDSVRAALAAPEGRVRKGDRVARDHRAGGRNLKS